MTWYDRFLATLPQKPIEIRKGAGVYLHLNVIIWHAHRRASAGFNVPSEPVYRLPLPAAASDIGSTLRNCLAVYDASGDNLSDYKDRSSAFLKATGFRLWKALEGPARSCWISEKDGVIELTPLKTEEVADRRRVFSHFDKEPLTITLDSTDEETGNCLLSTLDQSE